MEDRILRATPINKTAQMVVQRGFEYVSGKRFQGVHTLRCPEIRAFKGHENLTGAEKNHLTVIGMHAHKKGKWVVSCSCGTYELRTAKALKNDRAYGYCQECEHLRYLKWRGSRGR